MLIVPPAPVGITGVPTSGSTPMALGLLICPPVGEHEAVCQDIELSARPGTSWIRWQEATLHVMVMF